MVMTVSAALRYAREQLSSFSDEAANEARLIVAHLTGCELNRLPLCAATLDHSEIDQIVTQRRNGRPLQYIFGKWWFYKSEFLVGEGVLVPRQDTEILLETGLQLIKNKKSPKVADLCAGSGCIGISLALERPDAKVIAAEKYDEAYGWLKKNKEYCKALNLEAVQADVLAPFDQGFDLILCNPPYIPYGDKNVLSKEVLSEPHTALFGGEDGLYFYREISRLWKSRLTVGGHLAFEVGINEADEVANIMKTCGFSEIGTENDILGIPRVVFGTADAV
ncbi:MAG: peptide chain release factor N(5)-glutamine methyltransferase [Acutalibacteraceae bacterium]|nr:peptide chain release factor N(5)-glutamine methyltransferase [Acutalibacteraceae bacterium]